MVKVALCLYVLGTHNLLGTLLLENILYYNHSSSSAAMTMSIHFKSTASIISSLYTYLQFHFMFVYVCMCIVSLHLDIILLHKVLVGTTDVCLVCVFLLFIFIM